MFFKNGQVKSLKKRSGRAVWFSGLSAGSSSVSRTAFRGRGSAERTDACGGVEAERGRSQAGVEWGWSRGGVEMEWESDWEREWGVGGVGAEPG